MSRSKLPELDGRTLFRMLARGVRALTEQDASSSLTLPYPEDVQLALDHLVLACAHKRIDPPAGVPDLISWCAELAADEWPFPTPEGVHPTARLVDQGSRMLTRACAEVTAGVPTGVEELAITMMSEVVGAVTPESATRRRTFLIRTVVVDRAEHQGLFSGGAAALVFKNVRHLYGPAPAAWVIDDKLYLCPTCGLLAMPSDGGTQWCEGEICPRGVPVTTTYDAADCLVLASALRLFLALPGRTELSLLSRLASLGCPAMSVDFGLGRYRIALHSGDERTFRVYDRTQPTLLAERVSRDSVSLAVVPHQLLDTRPDFRGTFLASVPADCDVDLISDHVLTSLAGGSPSMKEA